MKEMVRRVARHSVYAVIPLSLLSFVFPNADWRLAFSTLLGGAISLGSFRAITWAVEKFLGKPMGQAIIIGISSVKILLIFVLLAVLAMFKLIHPVGVTVGFTVVLAIIVKEGLTFARKMQ
ncbi:MAG: ATP synthase subunit I [Chloroflexota bacterium]